MNFLITGGAGFIGSHLVDRLLKKNNDILVIDNYATGRRDNLVSHPNLKIIEGSIAEHDLVFQSIKDFRPDVVVHAAASYRNPDDWYEDSKTNILGTVNVIKAMEEYSLKRLIYFQTALCYGLKPLEQPITLSHPVLPNGSSYAISKTAAEFYVELSNLDYVTFRLANAYGPRNLSGPLPTFYKRLTENKSCFIMDTRRDFVFIEDMINCIEKAVYGRGRGTYHIASGRDYSIKELFDATTAVLNLNINVEIRQRQPDDVYSILLDPSRTEQDFDWKIETNLSTGIGKTIEYYKQYGVEETFTHLKQDAPEKEIA